MNLFSTFSWTWFRIQTFNPFIVNLYLFNIHDSAATYGIGAYLSELTYSLRGVEINVRIVHLHAVCPEFVIQQGSLPDNAENWYIPEVSNRNTLSGSIQQLEDYYRNVIHLLRIHIRDTTDLVFHFNYNQSYMLVSGLKKAFNCKTVFTLHYIKWAQFSERTCWISTPNCWIIHKNTSLPN